MNRTNLPKAIKKAMIALGGEASIQEVTEWINHYYPNKWKDNSISTAMADLTYPGNPSSQYAPEDRFLERVGRGIYRLRITQDVEERAEVMSRCENCKIHSYKDKKPQSIINKIWHWLTNIKP